MAASEIYAGRRRRDFRTRHQRDFGRGQKPRDQISYYARRKSTVDLYCDPAARPKAYRNLHLAPETSDTTKETLATLDRLIDERRDAGIALDLCDLSDADKVKTLKCLNVAREWSYLTTGICWKGQCWTNDRQLKEALKAISNKEAVCKAPRQSKRARGA